MDGHQRQPHTGKVNALMGQVCLIDGRLPVKHGQLRSDLEITRQIVEPSARKLRLAYRGKGSKRRGLAIAEQTAMDRSGLSSELDAMMRRQPAIPAKGVVDSSMTAAHAANLGLIPGHDLIDHDHQAAMGDERLELIAGYEHGVRSSFSAWGER